MFIIMEYNTTYYTGVSFADTANMTSIANIEEITFEFNAIRALLEEKLHIDKFDKSLKPPFLSMLYSNIMSSSFPQLLNAAHTSKPDGSEQFNIKNL